MSCVGRRGGGEAKTIHGGEMKKWRQYKKDAHKGMCMNGTEENKRRYKSMRNKVKKAVCEEMRDKADEALTELQNYPNGMFRLVRGLMTDSNEVEGGRCMRGSGGKLCFREKERGKVWMDYMERIMMWKETQ